MTEPCRVAGLRRRGPARAMKVKHVPSAWIEQEGRRLDCGDVVGGTVTHDAMRLFSRGETEAGYLFACLSSEYGRRQLKARAFGSSIPHLDESAVAGVVLPRLDDARMDDLGRRAFAVRTARHEAIGRERAARALVEGWIEERTAA